MHPRTQFTQHAFTRIQERLNLSRAEIAHLLDSDRAVPIGHEPGNAHRVHRLFFSIPDDQCFIAVQDIDDGSIITILPVDYAGWSVSFDAQRQAEALVRDVPGDRAPERVTHPAPAVPAMGRPRFAVIVRNERGRVRTFGTGSAPGTSAFFDALTHPTAIIRDHEPTRRWIREAIAAHILPGERVIGISGRIGKRGTPVSIDLCMLTEDQ